MTDKPDLRILATLKSEASFGDYTLTVKAGIVHIDEKGDVRSPNFSYEADGFNEYEGLVLRGHMSAWNREVDISDFYGRDLGFEDLYRVRLSQAEAMVKVLRRLSARFDKADEKFGATDYAGMCARFADAIGATARYPLGIYEHGGCFPATGTGYDWMTADGLRRYLGRKVEEWLTGNHLTRKAS